MSENIDNHPIHVLAFVSVPPRWSFPVVAYSMTRIVRCRHASRTTTSKVINTRCHQSFIYSSRTYNENDRGKTSGGYSLIYYLHQSQTFGRIVHEMLPFSIFPYERS